MYLFYHTISRPQERGNNIIKHGFAREREPPGEKKVPRNAAIEPFPMK